ncbi:DUF5682 family protein [Cellulomonas alba]|uniref:DUF5682 family protein n=1 Tax=Cellulomonas alba TaxID=3053467 RepID=A0ABT7SBW3_9CELL|nr:DUF5682 family protein [Cellulomonas alba]MDM7853677.1 DUF5682 family protein [Cellulomonas alba]
MTQTDADAPAPTSTADGVHVMGVRHHGPGSARAVARALAELQPDLVLVEGPADADDLIGFAQAGTLTPPVALLASLTDAPATAAFWPFAAFSPEWQALTWANANDVPARFIDLPASVSLAARAAPPDASVQDDEAGQPPVSLDPIATLAGAAGYDDPERWWEDVVESRLTDSTPFGVLTEAMAHLREAHPQPHDPDEARREAYMRQQIRAAQKAGHRRVAVVCGAWHAPALAGKLPPASVDTKLLAGLPKKKTTLTWIPWTSSRLARASGYGAGITSPGWYEHLFTTQSDVTASWLVRVGGALREKDLPVSSAHVIEAVRLAETLATLRGRHIPGLAEVTEATRAVLCDGDDDLVAYVTAQLVVGEHLGEVSDHVPTVPLDTDLRAVARRLRLSFDAAPRTLELDLRKETDLARSRLLHRLTLLDIDWAQPDHQRSRSTGTFREAWTLRWRPELAVAVVEAALWGTTVETAATARVVHDAVEAPLPTLTAMLEQTLLADLPRAADAVLEHVDVRAAHDGDIARLMAALPALVRAHRYSDVRGTPTADLGRVGDALLVRVCAGLAAAVAGLDDESALALRRLLDDVHTAVQLRDDDTGTALWLDTILALAGRTDISGALTGRATRLLLDAHRIDIRDAGLRLSRALSYGTVARHQAAWVEGFLAGGGLLLVHDRALLAVLDAWVATLAAPTFTDVMPLLRRTFGALPLGERRNLGDAVTRLPRSDGTPAPAADDGVDLELAAGPLRTVALLLGATR